MTESQSKIVECRAWYDNAYSQAGFAAQRRYPNEELLRFLGRHYFPLDSERRRRVRILEVGCGSGANLWMLAHEGFDVHGIDQSPQGLSLCAKMLKHWNAHATLKEANMTAVPYADNYFDAIVDVLASYCLDEKNFLVFLAEAKRLLRHGGHFFSVALSKASDAFKNPGPSSLIDASTLDGIRRPGSPFFDNTYPVRFVTPAEYHAALEEHGFRVIYNEIVGRTYSERHEYFEFVIVVGERTNAL